ncbi:MAG: DUF5685 family protein [Clostridiales Family XIII bacterium]|nr:DUF5685 family protein [Clostridiales Family XIII bacterium]
MPLKSELKLREFEVYTATYCAICHAVKRRYGELPRLLLSYDAVFLALLAAALAPARDGERFEAETFRCFVNPAKKRNLAAPSPQIDYAADMLVLLAYQNLKDDHADEGGFLYGAGETLLRRAGARAAGRHPEKAQAVAACLSEIAALEKENCGQIDRIADPFGRLMAEVTAFPADLPGFLDGLCEDILRRIGYHLGRVIYIFDAIDDLDKDREKGRYNPLLVAPEKEKIRLQETRTYRPVKDALDATLGLDLAKIAEALEMLPLSRFKPILDNIVYLGLNAVKDDILSDKPPGAKEKRRRYLKP